MPELTSTKLVIYLDIQLFLIGKSPFSLQDTALFAPPNVICNAHLSNAFAKQTSKTTPPHVQTMHAERREQRCGSRDVPLLLCRSFALCSATYLVRHTRYTTLFGHPTCPWPSFRPWDNQ